MGQGKKGFSFATFVSSHTVHHPNHIVRSKILNTVQLNVTRRRFRGVHFIFFFSAFLSRIESLLVSRRDSAIATRVSGVEEGVSANQYYYSFFFRGARTFRSQPDRVRREIMHSRSDAWRGRGWDTLAPTFARRRPAIYAQTKLHITFDSKPIRSLF